jgi:hypothetical protein
MMITKEQCMEEIVERFPGFSEAWRRHRASWADEEAGLCNDVAAFGDYIEQQIAGGHLNDVPEIIMFLEALLVDGDDDVQTAVTTCCLENLLNYVSAGRIPAQSFTHLLGPKSREYCRAWDTFTGVQTPGV